MKIKENKEKSTRNFAGYTEAPPHIEKELERAVRVKDSLPTPENLKLKKVSEQERKRTSRAWQRYRIKAHERGHRKPLSEILKEPTRRLDTSIILPESVYQWVKEKPNKAAFIRDTMIWQYKKTA